MMSAKDTEIMTTLEAATFLRTTPQTIRNLARKGELPGRKVGREWRFLKEGLEDWLKLSNGKGGDGADQQAENVW